MTPSFKQLRALAKTRQEKDLAQLRQRHGLFTGELGAQFFTLKLDTEKFSACLDTGKYSDFVSKQKQESIDAGVYATPTFYINGMPLVAPKMIEEFSALIDKETLEK